MKRTRSVLMNIKKTLLIILKEDPVLSVAYFSTAIIGSILLYVVYYAYKLMIDQVSFLNTGTISNTLFLVISTYLFFEYLSRFVNYTFNNFYFDYMIRAKLQNILTRLFMSKLAELDFAHLESGDTRNLIAKVESSFSARLPEILHRINQLVFNTFSIAFSLLIALRFSIINFILLSLVSLPVYYFRSKYGNVAWSSYSTNAPLVNRLSYLRHIFANFQTLAEIKIYGLSKYLIKDIHKLQNKIYEDYKKPIMQYTTLSTVSFILIPITIFFALWNFIQNMPVQQYTIGDFTFFLNALFTFSGQISSTLTNLGSVYENNLYAQDFFRLMEIKRTIYPIHPIHTFNKIEARKIEFKNVSFCYTGQKNLCINNVSFVINKGENVALVGNNGGGKTTITKLLLRFYDPTAGKILIDDIDLKKIPLTHWYEHLGILFQDFARYYFSLRENIVFGNINRRHSSLEFIHNAFMQAEGKELLQKLPKKYEQTLGRWFEGGIELSGGQWQKVAIARSIFREAPILILDEPTSAIDAVAETDIFNNLTKLYKQNTLIFISHRFSTVRKADKIIVMDKGKKVEEGTHQKLIKNNGLYQYFFSLQKVGYQ